MTYRDGDSPPDLISSNGDWGYTFENLDDMREFLENDRQRQIAIAQAKGDPVEVQRLIDLGSFLK